MIGNDAIELGCAPETAARVAFVSLGRAAAAYGHREYFSLLDLLEGDRLSLNQAGRAALRGARRVDPFRTDRPQSIAFTARTAAPSGP
jgi:hypothetical protein